MCGRIIFLFRYSGPKRMKIIGFFQTRFAMMFYNCYCVELLAVQFCSYAAVPRQEALIGELFCLGPLPSGNDVSVELKCYGPFHVWKCYRQHWQKVSNPCICVNDVHQCAYVIQHFFSVDLFWDVWISISAFFVPLRIFWGSFLSSWETGMIISILGKNILLLAELLLILRWEEVSCHSTPALSWIWYSNKGTIGSQCMFL